MNTGSHDKHINAKCIENLCKGMVHNIIPDLEKAKVSVDEALRNQEVLIETVQQENTKFVDCTSMGQLVDMMHEAKSYYNKLMTVKKDMNMLSDKTQRLKRRAVKLQQQKQKEEQYSIQRRERELEKEQQLIARVAKKSDTPSPSTNDHDSNTV
ncbi:hypothetical protein LOTGIDRAFT_105900 [Lottia gigantea]|uniref:Biogenesis of lysosome-related organelles complex 1 subunit 6 n=1 Tax=Lottia gigantea TaxID=225164 RepID=V4A707_LOTGI|nr:hypothetical protein LOTGIDRAFT_105900 [Lottia gigantea]ESO89056.1 hypothetical protein LOTGIDRAFT_105900 [Lottia gigantea]